MIKGWEHLRFWKHTWPSLGKHLSILSNLSYSPYGNAVLPERKNWFKALELTSFDKVRCVILGQDPYPTKGYANGLAFSVYPHVRPIPASLRNIFKEYQSDLGYPEPTTGDLTSWANAGVLLLNTILTVEEGKPLSHAGLGWEKLTFELLRSLDERGNVVGVLWGSAAKDYASALSGSKLVQSAHPSPLSAKGFFGTRPFSRVNAFLKANGQEEIDWKLR